MRGEPNTKVTLTIFRKDENRSFPVTIVREEIKTQSVKGKVMEPGYAWIRLSQFQERTVEDFVRKVEDVYKQEPNLKGLVLDLRNDPGGFAGCSRRDFGSLPARERDRGQHQRPAGRKQGHLQGIARVLHAPQRQRPAAPFACPSRPCPWWCW